MTTPDGHEPAVYLVLGNALPCAERGIGWLGASASTRVAPRTASTSGPHVALADACFEAAGGDPLTALAIAADVTANGAPARSTTADPPGTLSGVEARTAAQAAADSSAPRPRSSSPGALGVSGASMLTGRPDNDSRR